MEGAHGGGGSECGGSRLSEGKEGGVRMERAGMEGVREANEVKVKGVEGGVA